MILYHPRNDVYHCCFRFLRIIRQRNNQPIELIRLRIYDFLFLFPHCLLDVKFPRVEGVAAIRRDVGRMTSPYERLPDKKRLFSEMGDYHIQGLSLLLAKGVLAEEGEAIVIGDMFSSAHLAKIFETDLLAQELLFDAMPILDDLPVLGRLGLKDRTGLMEYRYDAV